MTSICCKTFQEAMEINCHWLTTDNQLPPVWKQQIFWVLHVWGQLIVQCKMVNKSDLWLRITHQYWLFMVDKKDCTSRDGITRQDDRRYRFRASFNYSIYSQLYLLLFCSRNTSPFSWLKQSRLIPYINYIIMEMHHIYCWKKINPVVPPNSRGISDEHKSEHFRPVLRPLGG